MTHAGAGGSIRVPQTGAGAGRHAERDDYDEAGGTYHGSRSAGDALSHARPVARASAAAYGVCGRLLTTIRAPRARWWPNAAGGTTSTAGAPTTSASGASASRTASSDAPVATA